MSGVAGEHGAPPDPAVLAAVVLAADQVWPRPVAPAPGPTTSAWRFSGRWWHKPAPLRRERPWSA